MILNHRVKKIALARLAVTAETWSLGIFRGLEGGPVGSACPPT